MNLAFQLDIQTDVAGVREITGVECEPTDEDASPELEMEAVGPGSWSLSFVIPDSFDGSETVFRRFARYGIDPEIAHEACRDAADARVA